MTMTMTKPKPKNMLTPHVAPVLGLAWVKTDGGHHIDNANMAKLLKGRGGARPGSGPKVGPDGPKKAQIHVKCTPKQLDRYSHAAKSRKVSRSAWICGVLNEAVETNQTKNLMTSLLKTHGFKFLYALEPLPPLIGIPNGASVKIRQRTGQWVSVYVKQSDEITLNRVLPDGTLYPIARNVSVNE